jgi:hypothetical protein
MGDVVLDRGEDDDGEGRGVLDGVEDLKRGAGGGRRV